MNELIAVEKLAEWQKLKALVLGSVSSPITKRVYNMALEEFMAWFQQEPRPGFTKATVSAWRVSLEERRLGSSSIIIRMSAIRKLAAEAADNGLLAPELAAGIARKRARNPSAFDENGPGHRRARHRCCSTRRISPRSVGSVTVPSSPFFSGAGSAGPRLLRSQWRTCSRATVAGVSSISLANTAGSAPSRCRIG